MAGQCKFPQRNQIEAGSTRALRQSRLADLTTEALRATGHDRGKAKVSEGGCSGLWLHLLLALRPVIADTAGSAADADADADAADDGNKRTIIIMAVDWSSQGDGVEGTYAAPVMIPAEWGTRDGRLVVSVGQPKTPPVTTTQLL